MTAPQRSLDTPNKCPQCGASLELTAQQMDCPNCHAYLIIDSRHIAVRVTQFDSLAAGLHPFDLPDPKAGMPVLRMQVPAGWGWTGGTRWTSNPVQAARVHFAIRDDQGITALEGMPSDYFGWTNDQNMQNRIPRGGNYYGTEFQPPATAMEALQHFILPRYRPIPGLQVIGREPVDALIQEISCNLKARGETSMVDAFCVHMCYMLDQVILFEQIEGVVLTSRRLSAGEHGTVESVNWCTSNVYACRARPEQFEQWCPVFRQMIDSIQINPLWYAYNQQTVQRLSQQAQLQVRQVNDKKPFRDTQSV
ncbi:MAG: hypothetical protein P4L50_08000 [Anaerolineaceae bacterium]|nr:hypothetical protein [Anaerolineaceae bacterium]